MLVKDLNLFTNAKININHLDVLLPSQQKKEFFIKAISVVYDGNIKELLEVIL